MLKEFTSFATPKYERDTLSAGASSATPTQAIKLIPANGSKHAAGTMLVNTLSINRPSPLPDRMRVFPSHDVCEFPKLPTGPQACEPGRYRDGEIFLFAFAGSMLVTRTPAPSFAKPKLRTR
jgi:hypothetical protein